jgi:sugar-specific transcriptional regulator TrmB
MSQEEVLKTLSDLGLTKLDSKIYIYLAKKGPQKGKEISKALKVQRQQVYRSLKNLRSRAIVSATLERPARFSAVPFEKVLDLFIRAKLEEAQTIQQEKSKLLSSWQAIQTEAAPDTSAKFMVIEGRNIIYSRIKQMINETKSQLSIISTVTGLIRADQLGLLDANFKKTLRSRVQFRLLTHLTEQNLSAMKALLKETPKAELRFEIRNPNLGLRLFPRMVIRDQEEVVFFINPNVDGSLQEQDNLCLWTNCKSLIDSFLAMFEELWRNSTDIEKKIAEIETGKPQSKTFVIRDADAIKKKYNEITQLAKEEIILLTSSSDLIKYWKKLPQLKNWIKKGVSIKIMAPIVKENWETMKQLSKFCTVKHVPIHYWGTTIVDGEHLFQFKTFSPYREELEPTSRFDNAFYTNDHEWVKTMKAALNDIWRSAQTPSAATLESITEPQGHPIFPLPNNDLRTKFDFKVIDFKPPGTITEKDVLNKIIHAKKIPAKDLFKDISKRYGSFAVGVIHPPDQFNLPDMIIQAWRHDKQSSFGEEDTIIVYLWLETRRGHAYVPVAVAVDNPNGQTIGRAMFAGTPAGKNIHLLKKDQIQVRVYGNTLFAGWTVPIPLFPAKYTLPPACILFEGYGDVRTSGYTVVQPSGFRVEEEDNAFDAFVTFIHPASKYSGPGTDGVLVRDQISTSIPPRYYGLR